MEYSQSFSGNRVYPSLFPALFSEEGKKYEGYFSDSNFVMPIEDAINEKGNEENNWVLVGNGGVGKTFTLFLLWQKYLKK